MSVMDFPLQRRRREVTMDKGLIREVEMKGLTLGVELGPEVVSREICPECPFKTSYCEFRMKLWLDKLDLAFVCKGTRAWATKGN